MTKPTPNDPRSMALQIAGLRANETHLPEDERVFEDPYAEYFFPPEVRNMFKDTAWVRSELAKYEQMMPGVNGAVVARIRYIDERLTEALAQGLQQLVIMGAGYDTRAYRIKGVERRVKVFEVDHPLTQAEKTARVAEIFGELPKHVAYVPLTFGQDRLDQELIQSGYAPDQCTLFIAEGLLMYIPPPAVETLLAFITRASGPGSALVADCFETTVIEGTSSLKEAHILRQFVQSQGTGLQFGIEEGKMAPFFQKRGFDPVGVVKASDCRAAYFKGKSAQRTVSEMFYFVHAVVAQSQG